jgi:DNA polymerase-3 subunit gamma/tau
LSYTALYRRFRPRVFEEIIGQRHITDTLKNQIHSDNIAHAYLFSGTRGTGKTSTAKIMARAINCLNPVDENPCNECEICKGMLDESLMDIVEIDAASNNGVDDVRELRENVKYPPSRAKFKVYIIDEVHMLSQGAFNALLKTLEEPPGYVVFILATTEPQKIPATILSRCQRYDFKRISAQSLIEHLRHVSTSLGVEADEKALALIVRNADGAARDALSILDQCVSFTEGVLTYDDVVNTLGLTTEHWLFNIVDCVIDYRASEAMGMVHDMVNEGKNLSHFIKSLTGHYRNLMLSKSGADLTYIMDSTEESIQETERQAGKLTMGEILRSIDVLTKLEAQSRWATQPRIHLEMTLVKLMQPETDLTVEGLLSRLEKLENQVATGVSIPAQSRISEPLTPSMRPQSAGAVSSPSVKRQNETSIEMKSEPKKVENSELTSPNTNASSGDYENDTVNTAQNSEVIEDSDQSIQPKGEAPSYGSDIAIEDVLSQWGQVLEIVRKTKIQVQAFLIEGTPVSVQDGALMIAFKDGYAFHMDMIEREENRKIVEAAVERVLKKSLRVRCDFDYNLSVSESKEETLSEEESVKAYFKDHDAKLKIID